MTTLRALKARLKVTRAKIRYCCKRIEERGTMASSSHFPRLRQLSKYEAQLQADIAKLELLKP